MLFTTRSKLIASFSGVSALVGAVCLLVGGQFLYRSVVNEAQTRVRMDLDAAREILEGRLKLIEVSLSVTALGGGFISAVKEQARTELTPRLDRLARFAALDFAGIMTEDNQVLCRISPATPTITGEQPANPITRLARAQGSVVSGAVILSRSFLLAENPSLAERAEIPILSHLGPNSPLQETGETTAGLALAAAIPIVDGDDTIGVLYGGTILNRNKDLIDKVVKTLFRDEQYEGHPFGVASMFLHDVRIATNVPSFSGEPAMGTAVSNAVRKHVLEHGNRWTERAFVVSDWYLTAYEPIEDIFGVRRGMLGIGVLEKKYIEIRRRAFTTFAVITLGCTLLALVLGYLIANRIMSPVNHLIKASRQVSEGNLAPDFGPTAKGELGLLQETFEDMLVAVGRQTAKNESRLWESEKQASIGRLAAGVAHEINDPLTGVLTYVHLLLRRKDLGEDLRNDLETVAEAAERVRKVVKGLLDFSRQIRLVSEPTDLNRLVSSTMPLLETQALVRGVAMTFVAGENLPVVVLDRYQLQGVLMNIVINAFDASGPGDQVTIRTELRPSPKDNIQLGVAITVRDTGTGILPEHMDQLFDPFFSTKDIGHGTGLGLAVSQGIVQRHGGTIQVESEVGKGSEFSVWLPAG